MQRRREAARFATWHPAIFFFSRPQRPLTQRGTRSGGWFEIRLDNDASKLVYYRRGALRLLSSDLRCGDAADALEMSAGLAHNGGHICKMRPRALPSYCAPDFLRCTRSGRIMATAPRKRDSLSPGTVLTALTLRSGDDFAEAADLMALDDDGAGASSDEDGERRRKTSVMRSSTDDEQTPAKDSVSAGLCWRKLWGQL
jgi:hypothetical protein